MTDRVRQRTTRRRRLVGLVPLALLPLFLSGCTRYPVWPIDPVSPVADHMDLVFSFITVIAILVVILVGGLMFYAVLRFGRRGPITDEEPPQVHGNTRLEVIWTLIPTLIVALLLAVAVSTLRLNAPPRQFPANTIQVNIRGYQWGWAYTFPQLPGLKVGAGDLHLPVNRAVVVRVTSSDVVHDWWVPALDGHLDAYPNHIETSWYVPHTVGKYYAQCSKFCGLLHWQMHNYVVVEPSAAFTKWAVANGAKQASVTALLQVAPSSIAAGPAKPGV